MAERYTIESVIGEGGEGSVYKAYDKVLKRPVALKRVLTKDRASAAEVDKAADALIAEAHTLSALNHPNVITVFDVGKDEEGGFVVMELIKGETLDKTVERGVFTEEDFYRFGRQTMEALMAAQEINVVHRDLKPGNVMIVWHPGGRFQAKILDFGLAKFSEAPSLQTMGFDDSVKGSIYFMAPEQFERTELDERTDLYAMGCVYYYALTGAHPFDGETATMVMVSHLQHQVVSLEKVRPDLPPVLCQWVMWLLNRDIKNRPENAEIALKHFPQQLTASGRHDLDNSPNLKDKPISEGRSGLTTGVQVVMPSHSAEAPAGLVMVAGEAGQPAAVGELDQSEPSYEEEFPEEERKKSEWLGAIIGGGLLLAGVLYFAWTMIEAVSEEVEVKGFANSEHEVKAVEVVARVKKVDLGHTRIARLDELSQGGLANGNANDAVLAMDFLASLETTKAQKDQAKAVLTGLEGEEIDAAIITRLKSTKEAAERIRLLDVLKNRGAKGMAPVLLEVFQTSESEDLQLTVLELLKQSVSMDDMPLVLESLKKKHPLEISNALEQLVAIVYRKLPASKAHLEPLMARAAKATGNERASLWRILGLRGGDAVVELLEKVFLKEKHDKQYLLDAMGALQLIQTPQVVGLLNSVYSTSTDGELKTKAAKAIACAVTVPSDDRSDVRSFWWQLAVKIVMDPEDLQKVFASISDFADTKAVKFLQGLGFSRTFASYSKVSLNKIEQYEKSAVVLGSGDLLPILSGGIRGEGARYEVEEKAVVQWTDPATSFVWHFKVKEAGVYNVEVLQSFANKGLSQFECIIGLAKLKGSAKQTDSWDQYQANSLGAVRLESGRTYSLFLIAGEVTQAQMMNIKALRLQKQ